MEILLRPGLDQFFAFIEAIRKESKGMATSWRKSHRLSERSGVSFGIMGKELRATLNGLNTIEL